MRKLCYHRQESITHGLGLVLKNPHRDYKRLNILSRHLALTDEGPVLLRKIPNTILTNATCSNRLTEDEGNYMAAMSLYSYSLDPLSEKLIEMRLKMVRKHYQLRQDVIEEQFIQDRTYKVGLLKRYTYKQCAFAYNMSESAFRSLVSMIHVNNGNLVLDLSVLNPEKPSTGIYEYGLFSNRFDKVMSHVDGIRSQRLQHGTAIMFINTPLPRWTLIRK